MGGVRLTFLVDGVFLRTKNDPARMASSVRPRGFGTAQVCHAPPAGRQQRSLPRQEAV